VARRAIAAAATAVLACGLAIVPGPHLSVHADITAYTGSSSVSGWINNQTDLLPTEVQDAKFGQQYDATISGQVFGQPLIADDGNGRRLLLAVTQNNEVYALNPDTATTTFWHAAGLSGTPTAGAAQIGAPWVIAKNNATKNCTDVTPNVGITTTPVIDASTRTAYFTAKTPDPADTTGATAMYKLHALSLVDGSERTGFPVTISGAADNDGTISFDATKELQRPGLLLMQGTVYMAFGGHCDTPTYYGWVVGVSAYDGTHTPAITARWTDQKASDGFGAGIWMAGSALASDGPSTLLLVTGNGTLPQANPPASVITKPPPNNLGQSAVRLTVQSNGKLQPVDFFSPKDNTTLNQTDLDLGSSGITVLPSQFGTTQHPSIAVIGGKTPVLRTLDLNNLGGYDSSTNHDLSETNYGVNGGTTGTWGRVGSWPGDGGWVYVVAMGDPVTAGSTRLSGLVALQRTVDTSGSVSFVVKGHDPAADNDWIQTSGSPTITSNGTSPLTAVVWVLQAFGHNLNQSRLLAFSPVPDASGNLPVLWTGPTLARGAKFTSVAVDGNHVYIGTRDNPVNQGGTSHIYGYWLSSVPDLSETPYWFGNQALNTSGTITQTLTVRANHAIKITGASSGDSHFTVGARTPADGTSLNPTAPGNTVQVPVSFAPTVTGDVRSTISLTIDDGTTVSIGVGGTGVSTPPTLTASPAALDFGNHATGTSTANSFQLGNSGSQPLTLSTNSISGNAHNAYSVQNMPVSGTTIAPGGSLPVQVTYAPTQPTSGTPDTATITVNSTNGGSVTVSITGTATPPGILSVSPLSLDAGNVPVGQSKVMHFTVANTGGTTITLSRSKPPGGDFTPLTNLPETSTINPGVSIGVDVQFTPSVAGPQSAVWSFNSDGQGGQQNVTFNGNGVGPPGSPPPPGAPTTGYWLTASDGGIFSFGNAQFYGSTGALTLNQPIVGMAPTPTHHGYWLVAADGGIFSFGDAQFYGSTGAIHLNRPIVGMAPTRSGNGYWLVASDGGIFSFGDALFYGSTGAIHLNQPIVGMAPTQSGNGYWLVASDGGIFSFGDALFHGSTGAIHLNQPVVGMAPTRGGNGYWLVASDGGIFSFGDALFHGSTGAIHLNQPIVGMAPTPGGAGYWLVASDGGIFAFGDAPFLGSTGAIRLNRPVVGMGT
jgi:hypothetical protein